MRLWVPVHLCGSVELQHMNSFAYIYCDEIVGLCSWARIHTSRSFFYAITLCLHLSKKKKKENHRIPKKKSPLGQFPKYNGTWISIQYNWITSEVFVESKMLHLNLVFCVANQSFFLSVLLLAVCTELFSLVASASRCVHRSTAQKSK